MLGAADTPPTACFFTLLKADAGGALESACAKLANLPARLARGGTAAAPDALPPLSFGSLDAALDILVTAGGVARAGLPPSAGRAAALSSHGYRCEAGALNHSGRTDAALLFLGRALEAAGIAAALSCLADAHNRGEALTPPRLRRLAAAAAPALIADARAAVAAVARAYVATAAGLAAATGALVALRRASPAAYRLVGAAARRADPGAGLRLAPAKPLRAVAAGAPAKPHAQPASPTTALAGPSTPPPASGEWRALRAKLLSLARGAGTLPHVPPPRAATW